MPPSCAPYCARVAAGALAALAALAPAAVAADAPLSLEQVRGYPFPTELTAAAGRSRVAWAVDDRGRRNVWVAEGPDFNPRRLTRFDADDGQELTGVSLSADGKYVVFVRGGDHGSNWDRGLPVNPLSLPDPPKLQLWSVPFAGGDPKVLADGGDSPTISPRGDVAAFVKDGQVWTAPLDGSAPAKRLFSARGACGSPVWSPDGSRLAFVSARTDHAFVGVYSDPATPIRWLDPSTARDGSPRWSPDGKRLAFVRRPGVGSDPAPAAAAPQPAWTIRVADADTGAGREVWRSPTNGRGGPPSTHGGTNLHWAAGDRLVFLSYADGWPHLYSVPAGGGAALLLTKGQYMAEHVRLSPDRRYLVFAGNTGPDPLDVDRRHLVRVPVDRAEVEVLTPGAGLEWSPVVTGDGRSVVFLSATAQRPPLPAVLPTGGGPVRLLGERQLADFPADQLVTPKQVVFKAPDGLEVHGQLFERPGGAAKKPAVVYVHGGPQRQMLLGWHSSPYYAHAYALNQYLAARGFVVLSVNYRLGIGYGYRFQYPGKTGANGAAEYQDIKAAGEYLRALPQVDPGRVGIYGGSYGGFLTALALGRDSGLFAAGVDIHGVHRFRAADPGDEDPGGKPADASVAWKSSPVSAVGTWKSPVLLVHGDDDRNVGFGQTVDLARRLAAAGVPFEQIVIPDDTHHFMRAANWLRVGAATADFLDRHLTGARAEPAPAPRPAGAAPAVTAKGWAVLDGATGEFLWGSAADTPLKSASTTKVMCAHVVLRLAAKDPKVLDEVVTFSKLADDTPGSTSGIKAGERLPVRDCLYALLLPSGNDAGNALAEHFNARLDPPAPELAKALGLDPKTLGTRINFVAEMNREAGRLGLKQTTYRLPYGDGGTAADRTTTARELGAVAWHALKDARFRELVGTRRYECKVTRPDGTTRAAAWENTNKLLARDGFDGVKTGTTAAAGTCLVSSGGGGADRLLVVVLGSESDAARYADTEALFRWARAKRRGPAAPPAPPAPPDGNPLVARDRVRLNLAGAEAALEAAKKKAAGLGLNCNVAVVDDGGHLLAFARMDGARPASAATALTKAVSAATFRQETGPLPPKGEPDLHLSLSLQAASGGKITTLKGGVPIVVDGQVVGAVGVGGGTGEQDAEVAKAGIQALLDGLRDKK